MICDVTADKELVTLEAWEKPKGSVVRVSATAFSPDGKYFAAIGVDSGLRYGSVEVQEGPIEFKSEPIKPKDNRGKKTEPREPHAVAPPPREVTKKDETPQFTFEHFDPVVLVWEVATGKVIAKGTAGTSLMNTIVFAPDGKSVFFGQGSSVRRLVWHEGNSSSAHVGSQSGQSGEVHAVAFDSANGLIWSAGDGKLILGHSPTEPHKEFSLRGCDTHDGDVPRGFARCQRTHRRHRGHVRRWRDHSPIPPSRAS